MDGNMKVPAPIPGALFDLAEDKPMADPLAELLKEILKIENAFEHGLECKIRAA